MVWTYIEWIGTILGLSGSLIMASKKLSHAYAWGVWIMSNLLFIGLFTYTQQYGLLFMNAFGLGTCSLGYWQWSKHKDINKTAMRVALSLSLVGISAATVLGLGFIFIHKKELIEWFGSLLSISGALLLASKHKKAAYSWIVWSVSNIVLLGFGIYNQQWGFATLQLGFTISNIYGTINWLWMSKGLENLHDR